MNSRNEENGTKRAKALAGTLLFHGLLFLFFFLYKMIIPNPPLFAGGSSGVEVNFGTSDEGMGDVQPEPVMNNTVAPQPQQAAPVSVRAEQEQKEVITQDVEEAPAVAPPEKKNKKPEKKAPVEPEKTKPTPITKPVEEIKQVPKPVVNSAALYKGKKSNATQGNEGETGKPGDQGIAEGSLYSKTHGNQNGSGAGGAGTGDGTGVGNGSGEGTGSGSGKGISFNLDGRRMVGVPRIDDRSQETGKVVVAITVDKFGSVIKAVPGIRGSTTTSSNLYAKAQQAALKAKFNPAPDGIEEQRGSITFVFIVQ